MRHLIIFAAAAIFFGLMDLSDQLDAIPRSAARCLALAMMLTVGELTARPTETKEEK